jgi:hypothetical protein
MEPLDRRNLPDGPEHATAAGRCELCESVHVRLVCGTVNAAHETDHGAWIECECACGIEWRVDIDIDHDGLPLTTEVTEMVRFRALSL